MIRRAAPGDIPALMHLLEQVNLVHHLGRPDLFRLGTKYGPGELEALLADPLRPVFVWEEDGQILGHAFCVIREPVPEDRLLVPVRTLYIDDVCVDAAARKRGIGRALCRHVLDYARSLGCHNVTLNVWDCNPEAERFYRNLGFKPQKICLEEIL